MARERPKSKEEREAEFIASCEDFVTNSEANHLNDLAADFLGATYYGSDEAGRLDSALAKENRRLNVTGDNFDEEEFRIGNVLGRDLHAEKPKKMGLEHAPIGDPQNFRIAPMLDPEIYQKAEFAFPKGIRNWWMRVVTGKEGYPICQYEYFDHNGALRQCKQRAEEVDHVDPESNTRARGQNPDGNIGLPLCVNHHRRYLGEEPWDKYSSVHPNMAKALKEYGSWKRGGEVGPSPFQKAQQENHDKALRGERIRSTAPEQDDYLAEKMANKATRHLAEHPDDKKPPAAPTGAVTTEVIRGGWLRRRR